jgi:hypothetical protein
MRTGSLLIGLLALVSAGDVARGERPDSLTRVAITLSMVVLKSRVA